MASALMPHQRAGVEFLRAHPRALLGDAPGLGKTAQALLSATEPVLVVAPAMLLGVWRDECAKWRPGLDMTTVSYSSVCEREGRKVLPVPRQEYRREWGTIICDEAHYLKNRKAKWTRAMVILSRHAARMQLLTGTPIPNWAHELYIPLRLMHGYGDRRYASYWRWIEEWFKWWQPPYGAPGHREITGLRNGVTWQEFVVGNELDRLMLRRDREEVLTDLPPLTEQWIEVEMGTAQRRAYNDLKRDYRAWVAEAGRDVLAFTDGGRHIKLWQATTGLPTLTNEPGTRGSCKIDALRELLGERVGEPVVVFVHFRATALSVVDLAGDMGVSCGIVMGGVAQGEREAIVARFQSGEIDLLVGTLDVLAEGVTLTRSCTCVMMEESYRPHKNEQAPLRLLRIGQENPVTAIHIVTADSLDQHIVERRNSKRNEQIEALTAAKFAALL